MSITFLQKVFLISRLIIGISSNDVLTLGIYSHNNEMLMCYLFLSSRKQSVTQKSKGIRAVRKSWVPIGRKWWQKNHVASHSVCIACCCKCILPRYFRRWRLSPLLLRIIVIVLVTSLLPDTNGTIFVIVFIIIVIIVVFVAAWKISSIDNIIVIVVDVIIFQEP